MTQIKVGDVVSVPDIGLLKGIVKDIRIYDFCEPDYKVKIIKHIFKRREKEKCEYGHRQLKLGESSAFQSLLCGYCDEENYEAYVERTESRWKRFIKKFKRRVRG